MRLRHCWLIITRRICFDFSTERMEFYMALENFKAAADRLDAAADRLIAKAAADEAALAQANADLAGADSAAAAIIQPIADRLNAAAPE
jgi:hypothetical protein